MAIRCRVTILDRLNTAKVRLWFQNQDSSASWPALAAGTASRPRTCALRRRKFSRSAAARRSLRVLGLPFLPVFGGVSLLLVMPALSVRRPPAQAGFACTDGGRMAVSAAFAPGDLPQRAKNSCRSSVVEHLIGNEEVECSIHSGSTIATLPPRAVRRIACHSQSAAHDGQPCACPRHLAHMPGRCDQSRQRDRVRIPVIEGMEIAVAHGCTRAHPIIDEAIHAPPGRPRMRLKSTIKKTATRWGTS